MPVGHNGINAIRDGRAVWETPADEERSIRPVIEHALTVYYDGNAELARTLIDRLLSEDRSQ